MCCLTQIAMKSFLFTVSSGFSEWRTAKAAMHGCEGFCVVSSSYICSSTWSFAYQEDTVIVKLLLQLLGNIPFSRSGWEMMRNFFCFRGIFIAEFLRVAPMKPDECFVVTEGCSFSILLSMFGLLSKQTCNLVKVSHSEFNFQVVLLKF